MKKKIGMIVGVFGIVLSLCYLAFGNPIVFFHNQELKHSITSIKDDTKAVTLNEKDNSVVASVCGYPDNIGYEVHFSGSVTCEEKAVFSVNREGDRIVLFEG